MSCMNEVLTIMEQPCQGCQCLSPLGMAGPSPRDAQKDGKVFLWLTDDVDNMCRKLFLFLDSYSSKMLSYRVLLLRSVRTASLLSYI